MKKNIKIIPIIAIVLTMLLTLAGCGGNSNTVQRCIISNDSFTTQDSLDAASQPENLTEKENVYASVYFIESPKGMEYTVKWYLDGNEIQSETKATINDMKDIIVFKLDAEKASAGTLKVKVMYDDTMLFSKEIAIK